MDMHVPHATPLVEGNERDEAKGKQNETENWKLKTENRKQQIINWQIDAHH